MRKSNIWLDCCLIGIGNHAKTRLIPALINSKKNIVGIVSKKKQTDTDFFLFKNIDVALKSLSPQTVFIVSSPPLSHFDIVKKILKNGGDVIVEKPAFISLTEASQITKLSEINQNIFVELLMYKHTELYNKFLNIWEKNINVIQELSCTFMLPSIPKSTFRDSNNIYNSCLYDIGCYPISLLVDLNVDLINLKINNFKFSNGKLNYIEIENVLGKIKLIIKIGIGFEYKNEVTIKFKNQNTISFSPFFYGKEEVKVINKVIYGNNTIIKFKDKNGFENLFNISRNNWSSTQKDRLNNLILTTKTLELFSKELVGHVIS